MPVSQNSLDNLKKGKLFKKNNKETGEVDPRINRTGLNRNEILDRVINKLCTDDEIEGWMNDIRRQLKRGNMKAAEILLDRTFGKVKQPVEADITQHGDSEIQIVITNDIRPLNQNYADSDTSAEPMGS